MDVLDILFLLSFIYLLLQIPQFVMMYQTNNFSFFLFLSLNIKHRAHKHTYVIFKNKDSIVSSSSLDRAVVEKIDLLSFQMSDYDDDEMDMPPNYDKMRGMGFICWREIPGTNDEVRNSAISFLH